MAWRSGEKAWRGVGNRKAAATVAKINMAPARAARHARRARLDQTWRRGVSCLASSSDIINQQRSGGSKQARNAA